MTSEKEHSIKLTEQHKKFCLSLHDNGVNSYMFVNGVEIYKFKAKDCGRNVAPSCLSNVSKEFFSWWHQKSSIDANDVDDSLDIHKHLMKKHNIK